MRKGHVFGLALLVLATYARAQIGAPIDPPVFVNSNNGSNDNCGGEGLPSIATDGLGVWIAVWPSEEFRCPSQDPTYPDIVFSRSTDGGRTWSDLALLHASTYNVDSWPIIRYGQGAFLVVWESDEGYGLANDTDADLYVVRSTDGGLSWSSPQPVNTDAATDGNGVFPPWAADDTRARIDTDGLGNWVAVWEGNHAYVHPTHIDLEIQYATSDNNGLSWSAPQILNSDWQADQISNDHRAFVHYGKGRWGVVWTRNADGDPDPISTTSDLLIVWSEDGGATWSTPNVIFDSSDEVSPRLTTNGEGRWILSWTEDFVPNGKARFAWSGDNGASWQPSGSPPLPPLVTEELPEYHFDGRGNWFATWVTKASLGGEGDLLISRGDLARGPWTPAEPFNTDAASDSLLEVAPADMATDLKGRTVGVFKSGNDVRAASFELQGFVANFSFVPPKPDVRQPVQFFDQSTGDIQSWSWDFDGDRIPDSTERNPTWVFSTKGPHPVTLRVNDGTETDAVTKTVLVGRTGVRVTKVTREFEGFFLEGLTVTNRFDVDVVWEGTPGNVAFSVDGAPPIVELGTATGASHTFDMENDFAPSFSPAILTITPKNGEGVEGQPSVEKIWVFPFPGWLEVAASDPFLTFAVGQGEITFSMGRDFPTPHFCENSLASFCKVDIPDIVPYINGQWGVEETFARVGGEISSKGTGTVEASGQTGFGAFDSTITGKITGKGVLDLGPPVGLNLESASLNLLLEGTIKAEKGILEAIGPTSAIANWPIAKWFNERAKLIGELSPSLSYTTMFKQKEGTLRWDESTNKIGLDAKGILKVNVIKDRLTASGWVGGGGSATVGVPSPLLRLLEAHVEIGVEYELDAILVIREGEFKCHSAIEWVPGTSLDLPWGCEGSGGPGSRGFRNVTLIEPAYDSFGPYAEMVEVAAPQTADSSAPESSQVSTVISNVFQGASPRLVETTAGLMLLWEHQDTGLPVLQSTEIAWSLNDGTGWSAMQIIAQDTQAELSPQMAVDANGKVVAVWLRNKVPAFSTPINDISELPLFYRELEVVGATFDPGTQAWGPVTALTGDTAMDGDLQLSSDGSGKLLLTWLSNPDGEFLSTATSPSTLEYSIWNPTTGTWSVPAVAASGLVGAVSTSTAHKGTEAFVMLTRDPDIAIDGDGELDLYTWSGTSWSGPTSFAPGGVDHRLATVAYDSTGEGHVVWLMGPDLVHATLSSTTPQTVRAGSESMGFYGMQLVGDAQENLALIWQEVADGEPADLFATIYDAQAQEWSLDLRLTEEAGVQHADVSGFFGADGVLRAAFLATDIQRTSAPIEVEGEILTFTNIPVEGQTDLRVLEDALEVDLTVADDDLTVNPSPPRSGQQAIVTLSVDNAGDLATGSFDVAIYFGDPDNGGALLDTETILGPFRAGDRTDVALGFILPSGPGDLVAVVDDGDLVAEHVETNNRATFYLENLPPVAKIVANPVGGPPPLSVQLDAGQSFDPDEDPISIDGWSFGDGTEGVTDSQVTHIFDRPGEFTVGLSVTDSKGAVGHATRAIVVTGGAGTLPDGVTLAGTPLTVARGIGDDLVLAWGAAAACGVGDTDYEIYEGTLGDFASHAPLLCSTGGDTTMSITPAATDAYYLVVPTNLTWEGSYGLRGDLTERPPSASACLQQGLASCATCGNGSVDPSEACDGTEMDGQTCQGLGFDGGTLSCGMMCEAVDARDCFFAGCGNGIVESGEVCDAGDLAGATCQAQGFDTGALGCNATCDGFDTAGCFLCGDGVCDLGGDEDCVSCTADCNGVQGGNPANRYCCGAGGGSSPIDCTDARCTASGNTCSINAAPVESGLVLHLETDQGVTASAGTVTGWADASGWGNDLEAVGDPTLLTAALNGRDVVRFDGSGDRLERLLTPNGLPDGGADRTVFIVVSYTGTGFGGFTYGSTACNGAFGLVVDPSGNLTVQGSCPLTSGGGDFSSTESGTGAGWLVHSAVVLGGTLTHYKNGVLIDGRTHTFDTTLAAIVVGAQLDGVPQVPMDVAAVLVYDRALTLGERWQIEGYLQQKYLGIAPP